MDRIQYVVSLYEGAWFVTFQGKRYGPYDSRADAIETAVRAAHQVPNSQVVVQGDHGPFRTEWTCGNDPRRYPG
jgi:Uncharacterized protein conserved in bacteria (DUF2188)